MTLLTWNHACSVGVRAMDDQHGILMDLLNEVRLAVVRGGGRASIHKLLGQLVEFTWLHLASEEQLMARAGFPDRAAHCVEHARLLQRLGRAVQLMEYGEEVPMWPLLCALRDGYLDHIEQMDRLYGHWLNAHGIS